LFPFNIAHSGPARSLQPATETVIPPEAADGIIVSSAAEKSASASAFAFLVVIPRRGSAFASNPFHQPKPKRVPHPSQSHREGWDRNRPLATEPLHSPLIVTLKRLIPLLLSLPLFLIFIFRPKIACQAPKPLNPLSINNIRVAY
jgi:hypothetical protein